MTAYDVRLVALSSDHIVAAGAGEQRAYADVLVDVPDFDCSIMRTGNFRAGTEKERENNGK